jgi:hypothetical protein
VASTSVAVKETTFMRKLQSQVQFRTFAGTRTQVHELGECRLRERSELDS